MRPVTGSGLRSHSSIVLTAELRGKVVVSIRPESFRSTGILTQPANGEYGGRRCFCERGKLGNLRFGVKIYDNDWCCALGIASATGSIETGKAADIIAFDGSPLVDITTLRKPILVIKEGCSFLERKKP
jgi:hypothetical protein